MVNDKPLKTIVFAGSGAISTALGNILSADESLTVWLLSIEEEVIISINQQHVNSSYFPKIALHPALKATADKNVLHTADALFLGIPSTAIIAYLHDIAGFLRPETLLINLAKGFYRTTAYSGCHPRLSAKPRSRDERLPSRVKSSTTSQRLSPSLRNPNSISTSFGRFSTEQPFILILVTT